MCAISNHCPWNRFKSTEGTVSSGGSWVHPAESAPAAIATARAALRENMRSSLAEVDAPACGRSETGKGRPGVTRATLWLRQPCLDVAGEVRGLGGRDHVTGGVVGGEA